MGRMINQGVESDFASYASAPLIYKSPVILAQGAAPGLIRTGSTAEGAILSVRIPGGLLGKHGQLRISAQLRRIVGASAVGTRLRFGAEGLAGDSIFAIEPPADGTIMYDAIIAARGSEAIQMASLPLTTQTAGSAPLELTKDMTVDQFVTFTGRTEGNAADQLELQRYQVMFYPG